MDLDFLFTILLYALMKKILNPQRVFYSLILQYDIGIINLLHTLLRLIQAYENKEIGYDFFWNQSFLSECFAYAIPIFIS